MMSQFTSSILGDGKQFELCELENRLRNAFKKCKIQDMTQLVERMKRTEERIQEYANEDRNDEVEKETGYLNELKQLQVLNEEIASKKSVLLLQTIDRLDLNELENQLKYGLDKCKIRDVTQLNERIERTEKRIQQYEDEDRTDEAKQEIGYSRDLEQLKRLTEEIFYRKSTGTTLNNNNDQYNQQRTTGEEENLLDHVTHMPCCAEKTITELLVDSQRRSLGGDRGVEKTSDLERLRNQLEKEELLSEKIQTCLQELNRTIYNQDYSSTVRVLTELLTKIRPLDLQEIQRCIEKSKKTASLINDKEIILLVGITGSGKSTTIQFLTGAKMKKTLVEIIPGKFLEHITIDGPIKNPGLNSVTTSPLSKSETRYVVPVTVQLRDILGAHETGEIILCDSPGFGDTGGSEVDISNSIGVVEAIKNCKSVKILALSSYLSLGDRGEGIQKLAHILTNMIDGIEERFSGILYAFTKYPPATDIHAILVDIKNSKVDQDSRLRSDTAFVTVLTDMIEKTKETVEMIDPIHGSPKSLIQKLKRLNGIHYPEEVFRITMSEETQTTILHQARRYASNIICALKHKDIDLLVYYLNSLKILNDLLQQSSVCDVYQSSLRITSESIDQYCTAVMGKFNRSLLSQDGLKDEDIREYKTAHDYIQQLQHLREHLGSNLISSEILIENILSELEKRCIALKEQDLQSSSIGIYLDNFYFSKNSFQQLESSYIKTCEDFSGWFQSISMQSVPELLLANEFEQLAERISIISNCLPILNRHFNGKVEENYHNIIQLVLEHLNSLSEKINSLLMKIRLSKNDIELLQSYLIPLRTAKETHSLQNQILKYVETMKTRNGSTIKDLNKLYDELIGKILNYFDQISSRMKELFDKHGNDALEFVEELIIQMEMIRTLPELEWKTARIFYHTIQNIRGYMQQWQRDAELLLDHHSGVIDFVALRRALSRLKKTEWIDRVDPGAYNSMLRHIREELEERAEQLERRLKGLDFSLKFPQNIRLAKEILEKMQAMSILEQSIPALKKYRETIDEHFFRNTKEAFDCIQKTFNLADQTLDRLKQELVELEQIKNEYHQLYPQRICLRKFGYSEINHLDLEIENCKTRQQTQLEELENQRHPMESQLNDLNTIVRHYDHLAFRDTGVHIFGQVMMKLGIAGFEQIQYDPNQYLNKKGYANIEMVDNTRTQIQDEYNQLLRRIEQKRMDFTRNLTHLQSIQTEYDSLVASRNPIAVDEVDFLREKKQTSYESLEKTIQQKKRILTDYEKHKQTFYFTEELDAATANNALIYTSDCEKVGHQQVKAMAEETDEFLRKYIGEYGYFLDKEIERSFKDIMNIDGGDPSEYSEDLERCFQEFLSLEKFPLIFESLHGAKKIEYWHRQFFDYHRSLDHQMEGYKVFAANTELKNLLIIAKALACIDRFCTLKLPVNGFYGLYQQCRIDIARMTEAGSKKIIDLIAKGDYAGAELELSYIVENLANSRYLTHIKHDLQSALRKILRNTEIWTHSLDGKIERGEDNLNKIRDINENIERIEIILDGKCLMDLIDPPLKNDLQQFEQRINEILSQVISKGLQSIEFFLNANYFLEAEQSMENLHRLQRELDNRCTSKSVQNKTEELKLRFNNLPNDLIQRYASTEIDNYSKNPPSDILDQLKRASAGGYAKYAKVHVSLIEQIRVNFSSVIERARGQLLKDRLVEIQSIKRAFHFLPDQLKPLFQSQIDRDDQSVEFD